MVPRVLLIVVIALILMILLFVVLLMSPVKWVTLIIKLQTSVPLIFQQGPRVVQRRGV